MDEKCRLSGKKWRLSGKKWHFKLLACVVNHSNPKSEVKFCSKNALPNKNPIIFETDKI